MKLHFAGSDNCRKYNDILVSAGAKNSLESFFMLSGQSDSQTRFNYMLDSGGFVARTKGKKISVVDYATYINKNGIEAAVELDTNDCKETIRNRRYLLARCKNTEILPVYHYSDFIGGVDVRCLIKTYKRICVGGVAGEGLGKKAEVLYDYIFSNTKDKVRVHGLGITAKNILSKYPFYSVDSTSWLGAARYGNMAHEKRKEIAKFKSKEVHYLQNTLSEARYWVKYEKYITDLWTKRGVVWDE